ncbi:MAG: hypothetical protein ACI4B5_01305 [Bacteroidaceae bacterium]
MGREEIRQRIHQLDMQIAIQPNNETLRIERGNLHWKVQDWQKCIADYDKAIRVNPNSKAVTLLEMVLKIITYYYKDRYNP